MWQRYAHHPLIRELDPWTGVIEKKYADFQIVRLVQAIVSRGVSTASLTDDIKNEIHIVQMLLGFRGRKATLHGVLHLHTPAKTPAVEMPGYPWIGASARVLNIHEGCAQLITYCPVEAQARPRMFSDLTITSHHCTCHRSNFK